MADVAEVPPVAGLVAQAAKRKRGNGDETRRNDDHNKQQRSHECTPRAASEGGS